MKKTGKPEEFKKVSEKLRDDPRKRQEHFLKLRGIKLKETPPKEPPAPPAPPAPK